MKVRDKLSRRTVLRGAMRGGAVAMALPFLDVFLDDHGVALASGRPMPQRFGTWFWGLGLTRGRWIPEKVGAGYDMPAELRPVEKFRDRLTVLSNYKIDLAGAPNHVHFSGNSAIRTGAVSRTQGVALAPSFETAISRHIGKGSRFRSIDVTCAGSQNDTYSWEAGNVLNPAETSPAALYQRLFGAGFQDPNASEFKADPELMATHSVLSAVQDDRKRLLQMVGSEDRQRLEQYFTSVREVEEQIAVGLQKPPPAEACVVPATIKDGPIGTDVEWVQANHKVFTDLVLMAVACDQARAFNIVYSPSASSLRRKGVSSNHHTLSHEEGVDSQLNYQPETTWFVEQSMLQWAAFLEAADSIKEGDRTLLDNMLVFAHSDCETARIHSIDGIPMMLAGSAGGRVRTGQHIAGNAESASRVGLTLQQIMGLQISSWGVASLEANRPVTELMA
jgi:hypothetical protein